MQTQTQKIILYNHKYIFQNICDEYYTPPLTNKKALNILVFYYLVVRLKRCRAVILEGKCSPVAEFVDVYLEHNYMYRLVSHLMDK